MIRIVTDSAADLPAAIAGKAGIAVVPLTVRFGDETFSDLTPDEFWRKLNASSEVPATAAPSAGAFEEVYAKLESDGATGIVSVHLSSKLSATAQSATVAASSSKVPVEVVDSLGASATTGLLALKASELAAAGATIDEISSELKAMIHRTKLYAVIDTLEYLRRGGRIGGAQALLGTMLQVKPVISVVEGVVEPVTRVRTKLRALQHIANLVEAEAARIERLVLLNANAPDVGTLAGMIRPLVEFEEDDIWTLGATVGAHCGPGALGVVYSLRS